MIYDVVNGLDAKISHIANNQKKAHLRIKQ